MSRALRRHLLAVAVALSCAGCNDAERMAPVSSGPCGPAQVALEDDIREVVFRSMFDKVPPTYSRASVFFIGNEFRIASPISTVKGLDDPSAALLKRFKDRVPVVKAFSESATGDRVTDRTTGQPGVIYSLGAVCWLNSNEVQVQAEHYVHPLNASGWTYKLRLESGRWVIISSQKDWVS